MAQTKMSKYADEIVKIQSNIERLEKAIEDQQLKLFETRMELFAYISTEYAEWKKGKRK